MHLEAELVETIRTYEWQCLECKICTMCRDAHDEVRERNLPPGEQTHHSCFGFCYNQDFLVWSGVFFCPSACAMSRSDEFNQPQRALCLPLHPVCVVCVRVSLSLSRSRSLSLSLSVWLCARACWIFLPSCVALRCTPQDKMLFCDSCDRGYHTFCVGLAALPKGKCCRFSMHTGIMLLCRRLFFLDIQQQHLPSPLSLSDATRGTSGTLRTWPARLSVPGDTLWAWGLLNCRSLGLQALRCLCIVWDDNTRST